MKISPKSTPPNNTISYIYIRENKILKIPNLLIHKIWQ